MRRHTPPGEIPRALHRTWWVPLAIVAATIVALVATPVAVSVRVQRLRTALSDGTNASRVAVNDLEVAVATEALALQRHDTVAADSAAQREHRDELALDSALVRIGPEAVEQFAQIRLVDRDWQRSARSDTAGHAISPTVALATIEAFDTTLERRADEQRTRIRALEHANVVSAVVLAPLALLATALLFWTGRRILFLAREATAGRAALDAALEEKSALLRGVTHDLKNPLGAVYGYGELLADGVLGELSSEQHDVIVRMQGLVTGALRTVSDLLDLYRDQGSALQIERKRVDLNRVAEGCVGDFAVSAQQKQVALRFERAEHEANATTDPARVKEILSNLLSNAVKYTPSGGDVLVTVSTPRNGSTDGAFHRISVCDTGPGIPVDQRERIFDEFYRLPDTASIPGSGVGLTFARRLARLLGGDIVVSDGATRGACFTVTFPVSDA